MGAVGAVIWLEPAHGGWALIQCDWCPYKKRSGHRHTQRDSEDPGGGGEEGHLHANEVTKRNCSPAGLGLEAGPGHPSSCLPGSRLSSSGSGLLGIPGLGLWSPLFLCPVWDLGAQPGAAQGDIPFASASVVCSAPSARSLFASCPKPPIPCQHPLDAFKT